MGKNTTQSNVLRGIIEKAVKGGWEKPSDFDFDYMIENSERFKIESWNQYIFSHDFAKAFWGEKEVCEECGSDYKDSKFGGYCTAKFCVDNPSSEKAWEYHLQQMVLMENPIKYLEKFL